MTLCPQQRFRAREQRRYAEALLIETRGLTEEGAFRRLRNRAMEKRCSMEEMASSLVEARDALNAALGGDWQADEPRDGKPPIHGGSDTGY